MENRTSLTQKITTSLEALSVSELAAVHRYILELANEHKAVVPATERPSAEPVDEIQQVKKHIRKLKNDDGEDRQYS